MDLVEEFLSFACLLPRAITNLREDCEVCRKIAPSQPAMSPTQLEVPEYPFQSEATDFFQEGNSHYFIFVQV